MSKNTQGIAVTALVAALIDGTIKASTLFKPPAVIPRTGKAASSRALKLRSDARKLLPAEDDRPLTELQAKEKLRILLTEVVRDTFRSEVVARILGGRKTLAEAVHEKDQPLLEGFAQLVSTTFSVSIQWKDISGYNFIGLMRDIWKRSTKKVKTTKPSKAKKVKPAALPTPTPDWSEPSTRDVCLDCDKNECECSDVLERPKKKAVKTKKEAKPVKMSDPKPYDNSHNWGYAGRIAQRSLDADSKTKTKTPMPKCTVCGSATCTDPNCEIW